MDRKTIFCTTPWFEIHINADGSYHTCGAQPSPSKIPITADFVQTHNVFTMSVDQWINSEYQRRARLDKLSGVYEPRCNICYNEESLGSSSKRLRDNAKSKIHDVEFDRSFHASPDHSRFQFSQLHNGKSDVLHPRSWHINLGNECNYACKMCGPWASSRLAVEGIQNGTYHGPAKLNWTENDQAWNQITDYMCACEDLQFVHIIGGEPLLNPKFSLLIDKLIASGRTDIYLGFTTNGSIVDVSLLEKLNVFRHVDIGVSIECLGPLNDVIRKGTNTLQVLDNIDVYLKHRKESHVYVTARPVPSALSVHTLDDLYKWCVSRQLDVMTNILVRPEYMQIQNLPQHIKHKLLDQYNQWDFSEPLPGPSNPRDPNRYKEHIDSEIRAVINLLQRDNDEQATKTLYHKLSEWKWLDLPEIKKYFVLERP